MDCTGYCIHRILNNGFTSNTYIVSVGNNCIVVDPGTLYSEELFNYLDTGKLSISYIILTHEHYDHCLGVNYLRDKIPNVKLVTSFFCNQNIQDDRMNLSRYADENGNGFTILPADIVVDCYSELILLGIQFRFLLTPGHSQGSMCFEFDRNFFSGDVIIPGSKPVLKLKGSSVTDYYQSIEILKKMYVDSKLNLYPGHGEFCSNYSFSQISYK